MNFFLNTGVYTLALRKKRILKQVIKTGKVNGFFESMKTETDFSTVYAKICNYTNLKKLSR